MNFYGISLKSWAQFPIFGKSCSHFRKTEKGSGWAESNGLNEFGSNRFYLKT